MNIENDVSTNLNNIINEQIAAVKKQKNIVTKCHQDNETVKRNLIVCFLVVSCYITCINLNLSFLLSYVFTGFGED